MAAKENIEQVVEESALELGVQSLKPKQREAILSYMSGRDTLVVCLKDTGNCLSMLFFLSFITR